MPKNHRRAVPRCPECGKPQRTAARCPVCRQYNAYLAELRREQHADRADFERLEILFRVEVYRLMRSLGIPLFE